MEKHRLENILRDKVVVITGAGEGLGRALARAFAREGCFVFGIGRTLSTLLETGSVLNAESYKAHQADVAYYEQVKAVFETIVDRHGRVDILFNNACVYPKVNFLDESADAWKAAIDVNLGGIANCCKLALPLMINAGFGRIFNVGSWADAAPIKNSAVYSCSKGGVHALTKAIAVDIADLNLDIEVHEWLPGHLKTRMSEYTGIDPSVSAGWAVMIASQPHASGKNRIFVHDHEWVPPKRLKNRIKEKLLFWKPTE